MLAPGIHPDISFEAYLRDELCEQPTLSRSGIHAILNGTMADYAAGNPRLTQWPESLDADGTDATKLGSIVHAMVLGGDNGAAYIVGDPSEHGVVKSGENKGNPYTTWTGDAKLWKQSMEGQGLIVIDRETKARALQIAVILTTAIEERFGKRAWSERKVEQTILWERTLDDGSRIWCKARPDAILPDGTIIDPKTTELPLDDASLGKRIALDGLDIQHAHYQDGLSEASLITDRPFIFAFIRTVAPFTVRFVDLDKEGWPLNITRMRIDLAAQRFGAALKSGVFEDHPIDAHPEAPTWAVDAWEKQVGLTGEIET